MDNLLTWSTFILLVFQDAGFTRLFNCISICSNHGQTWHEHAQVLKLQMLKGILFFLLIPTINQLLPDLQLTLASPVSWIFCKVAPPSACASSRPTPGWWSGIHKVLEQRHMSGTGNWDLPHGPKVSEVKLILQTVYMGDFYLLWHVGKVECGICKYWHSNY